MTIKAYRIKSPDGRTVEIVRPDLLDFALSHYNDKFREIDIDGNPIGEYTAEPCEAGSGWGV